MGLDMDLAMYRVVSQGSTVEQHQLQNYKLALPLVVWETFISLYFHFLIHAVTVRWYPVQRFLTRSACAQYNRKTNRNFKL